MLIVVAIIVEDHFQGLGAHPELSCHRLRNDIVYALLDHPLNFRVDRSLELDDVLSHFIQEESERLMISDLLI